MPDLTLVIPVLIVVIYLLSSIKILAEYERGVIFRLGRVLPQPKGPGVILVFAPIDRIVRISLRIEAMEVPAAGRGHARQRHGEGKCRGLFPGRGSDQGRARSRQFSVCNIASGANHAAQRSRRSGTR